MRDVQLKTKGCPRTTLWPKMSKTGDKCCSRCIFVYISLWSVSLGARNKWEVPWDHFVKFVFSDNVSHFVILRIIYELLLLLISKLSAYLLLCCANECWTVYHVFFFSFSLIYECLSPENLTQILTWILY